MNDPNITDLLKLAEALRAGAPVSVMPEIQPGQVPTGDYPDLLEPKYDNSTPGRYTPDFLSPEGQYIRDALNINRDTQPPIVDNPNAPKPPVRMEQKGNGPVFTTPYQHEGQYTPTPKPSATAPPTNNQPPATQPGQQQPVTAEPLPGLESYLQYFQKTLGASPELDKSKRNQLAMVAGINALGQALRQVVDYTGRVKHGSPIYKQEDTLTPSLLSMYDKEMQNYLTMKSQYDLRKTQGMQDAFKYAYGDKQAKDDFDREMLKLNDQQGFLSGEGDKTRGFEADEASKTRGWKSSEEENQRKWGTGEREGAQGDALERMKKQFGYDMELEKERNKGRAAGSGSSKLVEEIENGWEVMDNKNGQAVSLPKVMFWDVLTRELKSMNMTPDALMNSDRKPSEGYGSKEDEAKAIVTNGWNKYYDPVYENGKQIGWTAKPEAGNVKTIWDFIPMDGAPAASPQSTPGGDGTPEWAK